MSAKSNKFIASKPTGVGTISAGGSVDLITSGYGLGFNYSTETGFFFEGGLTFKGKF